MSNVVNPQQILQALAMRMAAARGQGSLSGIPGAVMPGSQTMPTAPPNQAPQAPPAAMVPTPQVQAPSQALPGPARQLSQASPTPFNGTFGNRQGIISQLVNSAEKRSHDKKVNEAEMYYNQINSFLASNDPSDQQRAQQLLDDPKVRKILKTGLDYVPLEEEVPPEAIGIHKAQQKIDKKQSALQKITQMLTGGRQQGNAQPRPQGRAIIPQPSQEAQQKWELEQAKTGTELAHGEEYLRLAQEHEAQAERDRAEQEKFKADAEQARGYAENARSQAKLYEQQAKDAADLNPLKASEARAHANQMNAEARWHDAQAKFLANGGKVPGSLINKSIEDIRSNMAIELKEYATDNNKIKDEMRKQSKVSKATGGYFGFGADPRQGSFEAEQKVFKMKRALSLYTSDGMQMIRDGNMTPPEAMRWAYKQAGLEPPVAGSVASDTGATTSTDDEIMKLIGQ